MKFNKPLIADLSGVMPKALDIQANLPVEMHWWEFLTHETIVQCFRRFLVVYLAFLLQGE